MKKSILSLFALALLIVACSQVKTTDQIIKELHTSGEYTKATAVIDSIIAINGDDIDKNYRYIFIKDSLAKIRYDFRKTKDEVLEYVKKRYPDVTDSTIAAWHLNGVMEYRVIDGDTLYFRNCAPNVFRVDPTAMTLYDAGDDGDRPLDSVLNINLPEILKTPTGEPTVPKRMRARFTIRVKPDMTEAGDTLRAWIPLPRTDFPRQTDFKLLATSDSCIIAPEESYAHKSAYMAKPAVAGETTTFWVEYEYTAWGQYFDLDNMKVEPYDTTSAVYKEYTAVRTPHLIKSAEMQKLAAEIVGDETCPVKKAQKIFDFVTKGQFPWASAINYSLIDDIPAYVIKNNKGDCGQVGLLFINLARCAGIPARWQSGLMYHPQSVNMHDWSEAYFEGIGWVPVDVSFGRNQALTEVPMGGRFFMGGMDSYRMVANSDYGRTFFPEKKYPRSETVDFQAGEVESSTRNLLCYRDWSWSAKVEYLD